MWDMYLLYGAAAVVVVVIMAIEKYVFPKPIKTSQLPSFEGLTGPKMGTPPINREALRLKLEDLFFHKRIDQSVLDELLVWLGVKTATAPITTVKPEMKVQQQRPQPIEIPSLQSTNVFGELKTPAPIPSSPVTLQNENSSIQSGFLNSSNIKTLLISGCALFVLSAYLFVRSYWAMIPGLLKFGTLAVLTLGIYIAGRVLSSKEETPKTAETLLGLAALLLPFNFYAANVLVFNHALNTFMSWSLGFAAMCVVAFTNLSMVPTLFMGVLMAAGFIGSMTLFGWAYQIPSQAQHALASFSVLITTLAALLFPSLKETKKGVLLVANLSTAFIIASLFMNEMFLNAPGQLPVVGTLLLLGVVLAIESRTLHPNFSYGAGLSFMGAVAVFLHHLHVPLQNYGLFFVPVSAVALIRAWTFEKSGRLELAAPYFHLSQLVLACSILATVPQFSSNARGGFSAVFILLLMAVCVYFLTAFLFQQSVFTYLSSAVLFYSVWSFIWQFDLPFAGGVLVMSGAASVMSLLGTAFRRDKEEMWGIPFLTMGLGCVSLCLALLAGKWASPLLSSGHWASGLDPEQLRSGLWVGGMTAAIYAITGFIKKNASTVFPVLGSLTLEYIFILERFNLPVNLLNLAWVVAAAMLIFYGINWLKKGSLLAQCFSLYGELAAIILALGATFSGADSSLPALRVLTASFLPSVLLGRLDLVVGFLVGVYLTHFQWFLRGNPQGWDGAYTYAGQLLFINCGLVFLRSLLTLWKKDLNLWPYRVFIGLFSVVSLAAALSDPSKSWHIYLATALLAFAVSRIHYEGRYDIIGSFLLLATYELFLHAQHVTLTEAYTVPAALFLLVVGFLSKDGRDARNTLYILGQAVLYLPSFSKGLHETWEWHGLFVGVSSLVLMLVGMSLRNKVLTFGSLIVLLLNGIVQSVQFLTAIPRWFYLGTGGILLMTLGGLFEFKRETLLRTRDRLWEMFDQWD